jgi:hypothetical protein
MILNKKKVTPMNIIPKKFYKAEELKTKQLVSSLYMEN